MDRSLFDLREPTAARPVTEPVVVGPSFSWLARLSGLFCFVFINPLFIYIWIDNPKFVSGPIDFPEIFMGVVTAGMIALGVIGLFTFFARTEVHRGWLVMRWARRRNVGFDEIAFVESLGCHLGCHIMTLRLTNGRRSEFVGGTAGLAEAFALIAEYYPKSQPLVAPSLPFSA